VSSFHPAFDLCLDTTCDGPFAEYSRRLNFETGEVAVVWRDGGADMRRRLFVSRADDVIALVVQGSQPGRVATRIRLEPHPFLQKLGMGFLGTPCPNPFPIEFAVENAGEGPWIAIRAKYIDGSGEYGGLAKVIVRGGRCETSNGSVGVRNADSISSL